MDDLERGTGNAKLQRLEQLLSDDAIELEVRVVTCSDNEVAATLSDLCTAFSESMRIMEVPAVRESLDLIRQYASKVLVFDCPEIRSCNLLENLLWIVLTDEMDFAMTLRVEAMQTYARLLRSSHTDLCELVVQSGQLEALGLVYHTQMIELVEQLPICLCSIAQHCSECHAAVITYVPKDVVRGFLEASPDQSQLHRDGLTLLIALCRRPFHQPEFIRYTLNTFMEILARTDEETIDALLGIAYWIENVTPEFDWYPALEQHEYWPLLLGCLQLNGTGARIGIAKIVQKMFKRHQPLVHIDILFLARPLSEQLDMSNSVQMLMLKLTTCVLSEVITDRGWMRFIPEQIVEQIANKYDEAPFQVKEAMCLCMAQLARNGRNAFRLELIKHGAVERMVDMITQAGDATVTSCLIGLQSLFRAGAQENGINLCDEPLEQSQALSILRDLALTGENKSCTLQAQKICEMIEFEPDPKPPVFLF